ncbi:zinc-binding dehydrogenase [Alteribacillus sp. YIM 98480]|uniref:zinc-dependent alcohol dehydrogenase n=1 Tax=Alteribacillus sp. YIM 98480 TaxID=2606599 RepID=UPI00131DE419|nr:alcohol dehydrogenase catalytic domain-containing protein [Alteribacillus sp. YIM 98480]
MKALVYKGPNQLTIEDKPIPQPNHGEVLIKLAYAGICGTDMLCYHGGMENRVRPPVILGHEFSGTVETVGLESKFHKGDKVTVEPLITCGRCNGCQIGEYNLCSSLNLIGIDSDGAMAGYICVPEENVYKLTDNISLKAAAFVEPLAVCVHLAQKAEITDGQNVLIVGGGPIGLISAFVARIKGARVFISEIEDFRIRTAEEFGFEVINPNKESVIETLEDKTDKRGADISIEATGTDTGLITCIEATGVKGTVVVAGLPKKPATIDTYRIVAKEINMIGTRVYKKEDYVEALQLMQSGKFNPHPLISRIESLETVIENGFRAIDRREEVIKILIDFENEG